MTKIYQVELNSKFNIPPIWIKTNGRITILENSCLANLKEIDILENDSGIDIIVEVSHD